MKPVFVTPDWPLKDKVNVVTTTRFGGISLPPYHQFNLAAHVGDDIEHVNSNRQHLVRLLNLPAEPKWLQQVHSRHVINAGLADTEQQADASFTIDDDVVCVVMTADCLPVVFSDLHGRCIGVAHAGWKGMLDGVLQSTIKEMSNFSRPEVAWLGPAIGPDVFEVGADVYQAYVDQDAQFKQAFEIKNTTKWNFNLYQVASIILKTSGVNHIYGGEYCTFTDKERFYSYRRDGITGRMATLVWKSQ